MPAPLTDDEALALAEADAGAPGSGRLAAGDTAAPGSGRLAELCARAREIRDVAFGRLEPVSPQASSAPPRRVVTFSPKVFLPVTNLCRNRCDYCSFRRSPGDAGEWTMSPAEVADVARRGQAAGCAEALLCLGDQPETAFPSYRRTLEAWGHDSTVAYLVEAARISLEHGLLPHTNAGVLRAAEMQRLRPWNPSLGLMVENVALRLCEPGMPHHRAPDKRPARRLRMLEEAGELRIPFTTGILVGIGETPRERVEALLAIRASHRRHGHVQEVIVQNFAPRPEVAMADRAPADDAEFLRTVALARLILPPEVSLQAPPNLNPGRIAALLDAGINDWGGISPITPDYVNHRHAWPHLGELAAACAARGFELRPRACLYPRFLEEPGWLDPALRPVVEATVERLERAPSASALLPVSLQAPGGAPLERLAAHLT